MSMIKYLAVFVKKLKNCIPERTLTGENWSSLKVGELAVGSGRSGPVSGGHPQSLLLIVSSALWAGNGKWVPRACTWTLPRCPGHTRAVSGEAVGTAGPRHASTPCGQRRAGHWEGRLTPGRGGAAPGACPDASGQHAARLGFLTLPRRREQVCCALAVMDEGGRWTEESAGSVSRLLSQPVPAEPEARGQGARVTGASCLEAASTTEPPRSGSCLRAACRRGWLKGTLDLSLDGLN